MNWAEQLAYPNRPVTSVSWFEATAYAAWLELQRQVWLSEFSVDTNPNNDLWSSYSSQSFTENVQIRNKFRLRLPLEDEWERAARESSEKKFPSGNNEEDIHSKANLNKKIGHKTTVGSYPSNTLGLYDMVGNVYEWQANLYTDNYKKAIIKKNYSIKQSFEWDTADKPSIRGGSFDEGIENARCSFRGAFPALGFLDTLGFRLVLSVADTETLTGSA